MLPVVGPALAPYQPSQRHMVLDERHTAADDVRLRKLTRAVVLLEQSRTPEQLAREDDPQRLEAIGEAIVRCETSDELLRRAAPGAGTAH